ncbi:MAG: hypothetical protein KGR98_04675 [Verrucomicrobia bacterium]|nr:hypothetical protein [Verrucomicrobiota bacterium]MDE3100571.1 hypothetical protein [Verrucomicrobiota bacterium]
MPTPLPDRRQAGETSQNAAGRGMVSKLWRLAFFLCAALLQDRAPLGYEDENGFHFGQAPIVSLSAQVAPTGEDIR